MVLLFSVTRSSGEHTSHVEESSTFSLEEVKIGFLKSSELKTWGTFYREEIIQIEVHEFCINDISTDSWNPVISEFPEIKMTQLQTSHFAGQMPGFQWSWPLL